MTRPIILSAGGTGGHMFPAAALAAELTRRGVPVIIVSDTRGARYQKAFNDLPFHILTAGTPTGGFVGKLRGGVQLLYGVLQAVRLLRRLKPAAVIGFGGYPSVPAVAAAQLLHLPTILHEQNAVMGKANMLLARHATRIATSYAETSRLPPGLDARITLTGPLVRAEIAALHDAPYPPLTNGGPLRILIMGGSQGARILSTIVPAAFALLPPAQRQRLHIVQQSRAEDLAEARAAYAAAGIDARLSPFIDDVPAQLAAAHIFIGRAGGTVAEVTAAGRPAIFIPYPHHADQQQKINAEAVAKAGGAWVMEEPGLTAEVLAARLTGILYDPTTLTTAVAAARAVGYANAAQKLADEIIHFAEKG